MVTLTRERVFEAAPIDKERRAHLRQLLVEYSDSWTADKVFWEAWEQLIKWYRFECRDIGEERAFWGLVYRLLDDPTADDIACIQGWTYLKWRISEGFYAN